MRNTLLALLFTCVAAAAPAHAKASKQETIGVGAGGIVGAAAGGPVGFVIGAAIGAKIGDTMHKKNDRIDALSASLDQSDAERESLQRDNELLDANVDALGSEIERLQHTTRPEVVSLLQAGIAMDLLFRTDESVLSDATGVRLNELAQTLATMPDIRVQLDGFADERGDETYNHALSEKRVEFVRDQLVGAGIDDSRISIAAHGESPAQDESIDSYALERRVSLTLFIDNTPSVAANPAEF